MTGASIRLGKNYNHHIHFNNHEKEKKQKN